MSIIKSITDQVADWAFGCDPEALNYPEYLSLINYYARTRFSEYHPAAGSYPDFLVRFSSWLNNVPDAIDQKLLLKLVPYIFFVGSQDFNALYRSAYKGVITRWIIDQDSISILDPMLNDKLALAIGKTWFCPITDSMQIAAFHHVNNISGRNYRPDWRSMDKFGCEIKLRDYIRSQKITKIVLLEDFVGSGSQMAKTMEFVTQFNIPTLIIPLIVCERGVDVGRAAESRYRSLLTFEPILVIHNSSLISPSQTPNEDFFHSGVRDFAKKSYPLVCGGSPILGTSPYGPFGFKETGALTVMYTNCPNNTLPLIHHKSATWTPLFPRSERI